MLAQARAVRRHRDRLRLHEPFAWLRTAAAARNCRARDPPRARSGRHAFRYRGACTASAPTSSSSARFSARAPTTSSSPASAGCSAATANASWMADPKPSAPSASSRLRNLKTDRIDLYYLHRWDKRDSHRGQSSARWRTWCAPARSARSVCPKWARRRCAARMPCTPSWRCSPNTRCGRAIRKSRCWKSAAASARRSSRSARWAAGILTGDLRSPADLVEGDLRRGMPRFQSPNFEENRRLLEPLDEIASCRSLHARATRAGLGAEPGIRTRW